MLQEEREEGEAGGEMEQKCKAAMSDIVCLSPDRLAQKQRHASNPPHQGLGWSRGQRQTRPEQASVRDTSQTQPSAAEPAFGNTCNCKMKDDTSSAELCLCFSFTLCRGGGSSALALAQPSASLEPCLGHLPARSSSPSRWGLRTGAAEALAALSS